MSYEEDSPPVFPFNTPDFTITDEDNVFLLQAILTVQTAGEMHHYIHTYMKLTIEHNIH